MLRTELLAELQGVTNIAASGGILSDAELMAYLAEGQDKFCERTEFFRDFVTFNLVTTVGSAAYTIDPRIIEIDGLYDAANTTWLGRTNEQLQRGPGVTDRYPVYFSDSTADTSYWQADQESGIITLVPTPTTIRTFTLRVWRYPLVALDHQTASVYDTEPEIPAKFHRAMVEWAAYKAFMHHDMEMQDPVKAGEHLDAFTQYIRDAATAFRRLTRQEVGIGFDAAYST